MTLCRKLLFIPILVVLIPSCLRAQSLFTIDGGATSKEEFIRAYNKNNNGTKPTDKSYRDYLDLYIRYKLKVQAAYDDDLDTLPAQRTELQNFRSQVADTYLKDDESLARLIKEVSVRGQKDIKLAHIFIALPKNASAMDTLRGYEKVMNAYSALKKGRKFGETAMAFSEDPSVKSNRGDIGYITVFTLPYELENLAYSLAPGEYSKPYHSKGGYHIFKNLGERKSLGRIKVAQILLSFPPGATEAAQAGVKKRADSIYGLLQHGADFASLARSVSGDNLSYQNGGELPEFGIGRYDSAFEAAVYALDRDGAISKPLPSVYGYHIIKRISRKPFPSKLDEATMAVLKQQVQNDPRIEVSRQALLSRVLRETGFRRPGIPESDLWILTDSAQRNAGFTSYRGVGPSTVIFSFPQRSFTVKEWLDYVKTARTQRTGSGISDKDLFDKYIERSALDYYRNHLEEYNKDFAFQLMGFKEGNLLFEIMQRKIWDKASADSTGLKNYYDAHKDKYWWDASADAILFTGNNEKTAQMMKARLLRYPIAEWRRSADSAGAAIQADSGRYELAQLPGGAANTEPAALSFTPPITNKADNTVSFAYILHVYHERSPRNYRDARGFVINDYQASLEDQWIDILKKKYPVKVNEAVLAGLPK